MLRGYLLPQLRTLLTDRLYWSSPVLYGACGIYRLSLGGIITEQTIWLSMVGILAMIVFCVVLGVIEGYISIRLESVIPAAMIHSAVNAGAGPNTSNEKRI